MNGYWYDYELRPARHRKDICLATNDPEKYCNGYYKYSTKDPVIGNGPFVIIDSNDPEVIVLLIENGTK